MKRFLLILSLILLAVGFLALILAPQIWKPEPLFVFRVGMGAGVSVVFFFFAILILIVLAARDRGSDQAARKVARERDESHRQFLRRLDHELKNPLTGLQATLTNLREAENDAEIRQGAPPGRYRAAGF